MIIKETTVINGLKVELEEDQEQRLFAALCHVLVYHRGFPSGSPVEGPAWFNATEEEIGGGGGGGEEGHARVAWNQYFRSMQYAMKLIASEAAPPSTQELKLPEGKEKAKEKRS